MPKSQINYRKIFCFLIILTGLSSSIFYGFLQIFGQLTTQNLPLLAPGYMLTPLISAKLTEFMFANSSPPRPLFPLTINLNRYYLLAWLSPVVLMMASLLVAWLWPDSFFEYNSLALAHRASPFASFSEILQMENFYSHNPVLPGQVLFTGLILGIGTSTLLAYGEERGWRGFLSLELQPLGFWPSSWLTGFLWGLWHLPLILSGYNFPDHPVLGVPLMAVSCMLMSPWIVLLVKKCNHHPLAAALFHGSLNGVSGLSFLFISNNNDLVVGPFALSGIISLIFLNLGLFIWSKFYPLAFK